MNIKSNNVKMLGIREAEKKEEKNYGRKKNCRSYTHSGIATLALNNRYSDSHWNK